MSTFAQLIHLHLCHPVFAGDDLGQAGGVDVSSRDDADEPALAGSLDHLALAGAPIAGRRSEAVGGEDGDGAVPRAHNWSTMLRVLISHPKDGLLLTDM